MVAVRYAEQTVVGDKTGPEKKAIVTKLLEEMLIAKHIMNEIDKLPIYN